MLIFVYAVTPLDLLTVCTLLRLNPILTLRLFLPTCVMLLAVGYRPPGRDQKEVQCACQVTVLVVRTYLQRVSKSGSGSRPLYTRGPGCAVGTGCQRIPAYFVAYMYLHVCYCG